LIRFGRVVLMMVVLASLGAFAQAGADAHVLSGARAFRNGEWAAALVEFRVALKLGAPASVRWYEGAALARSERFEEAVGSFELAFEQAPSARDPLLDYYRALSCFELQLWGCVVEVTSELERTGGPRVQQQVKVMAGEAKQLLSTEPPPAAIDACFTRSRAAGSPSLSRAWLREAVRLGKRRADAFRVNEAEQALSGAKVN
jgi:tetratricopeptide (TPR) repeat protein